jgi:hypothetical protein
MCRETKSKLSAMNEKYVWQYYWPLMNAHILGCTINEPNFADLVIDIIEQAIPEVMYPDADTIIHIFSTDGHGISDVLQRFIVDRWFEAVSDGGFTDVDASGLPRAFVDFALHHAVELRSSDSRENQSSCRYHTHKTPDLCYRLKVTPGNLQKKTELDFAHGKTQRDSFAAVIDASVSEVKCIDWEQRRMEGNNAMCENTRRKWIAFQRKGEQPPLPKGLNSDFGTNGDFQAPGADISVTTQTDETVDEIVRTPPSRPPPPSSAATESSVSNVVPLKHAEALPVYQAKADGQVKIVEPTASCTNVSVVTPASSLWSRPDSELRQSWETALKYGKRSACPGAFPESREGSSRSVTP